MARLLDRLDWLLFLLLGAIWGSSFLFIKIGVGSLGPLELVMLRLFFAALLLSAVVGAHREPLPRDRSTIRHLFVLCLLNVVVPFILISWGETTIDSGMASILNSTTPLFTIVVASVVIGEAITSSRVAGLVVGFAGVVIAVSGDVRGGELAGAAAIGLAALSYAVGAVYARRNLRQVRPMITSLGQVALALPIVAMLTVVFAHPWTVAITPQALFATIWLGVLGSGVAYLIQFRLLARWDATRQTLVTYLLPIVGVTLGAVFLGEVVDWRIVVGTALVIGGVALVNLHALRKVMARRQPARRVGIGTGPQLVTEDAAEGARRPR